MTRLDHAIVGGLVALLAVITVAIGAPALAPGAAGLASPSANPSLLETVAYREGSLGRPISVNPLAARTQVDRDLVALAFSGLVRLGPDGSVVPDLATRWSSDASGKTWTFELRPDARWHDGEPVTANDVVFTVRTLRDPAYQGPGAGSWNEATATAIGDRTVRFDLATPIGGFLQLATQPIAPAHLLDGVPIESLATDPFGRTPVGSGPYAITELDDGHAVLEPASTVAQPAIDAASPEPAFGALPTDTIATPRPTKRPGSPIPAIGRIELRFFDNPAALAAAFRAGDLDAASGLPAADAQALATSANARTLRYPGTTLTTIILNLRPSHPELRDPQVRRALLAAIDRPAIISSAFGGFAVAADSPIPPTSWAFDATASPTVAHSAKAAAAALTKAGWKKTAGKWRPAGATAPYTIELLSPSEATNPAVAAIANAVAANWQSIGLTTKVVPEDAGSPLIEVLTAGSFTAAAVDVSIGHDPDLYPLLASSQTQTGGLNVIGLQDASLDKLLVAARQPGTMETRKPAFTALETQLSAGTFVLPIAFADEVVVVRSNLQQVVVQPVGDPSDRFYDVLTWRLANDR
jgi:peptide/nickel transport system substrate-binding protein